MENKTLKEDLITRLENNIMEKLRTIFLQFSSCFKYWLSLFSREAI